jgi:hypothetical protein
MDVSELKKEWTPSEDIKFSSSPEDVERFAENRVWRDMCYLLSERIKENLNILACINFREQPDLASVCQQNVAVCQTVLELPSVIQDWVSRPVETEAPEEEKEIEHYAQGSDIYS